MFTIKYFESFLEHESKDETEDLIPETTCQSYRNSFYFVCKVPHDEKYILKVMPTMEAFILQVPKSDDIVCAFSAFSKNESYFLDFEDGEIYRWIKNVLERSFFVF